MSTIKQVADQAKVSVATVSRVINKTGYVSLDLQERVLIAMRDLNYQPSALARSLRRQETQTIGVLVPQLNHPFFGTLAYAVEKTLFANQYRAFICSAEESHEREDAYIDMLLRQRVDGVILVPTGRSAISVNRMIEQKVPVVLIDRDLPAVEISRVLCDNERGAYEAARHLVDLGHRRIVIIGAMVYSEAVVQRLRGIRRAFEEAGIVDSPEPKIPISLEQFEMGYNVAIDVLSHSHRPTAIFALNDVIAVGVLHAASKLGLRVPDDLSVVGFDDIPLASYSIPELTTVAQPIYKMGEAAAQILLEQVVEHTLLPERVILESQLVVRNSTATPNVS